MYTFKLLDVTNDENKKGLFLFPQDSANYLYWSRIVVMLCLKKCVIHAQKYWDEDYREEKKNENTAETNIRIKKKSGHPQASLGIIVASLYRLNDIDDVRRENESSFINKRSKVFEAFITCFQIKSID